MANQPIHAMKACRKCGVEKPHDAEHFMLKLGKLTPLCRPCSAADCKRRYEQNREARQADNRARWNANKDRYHSAQRRYYQENIDAIRIANKAYAESHKDQRRETHRAWTKANPDRVAAYNRARRQNNPEREAERQRRWRLENIDHVRARQKAAYDADPERHREYGRRWYRKHRERILQDAREWRKANKDKVREWSHRRRAVTEAPGGFTAKDVGMIYGEQDGLCTYCLAELDDTCEADHFVPIARGGSNASENIVLACLPCNRSKGAKLPWDWRPDLFGAPD